MTRREGDVKKIGFCFNSPVVLSFVISCFAVTMIGNLNGGRIRQLLFMAYHSSFIDPLTYLRLFTHVLGHADWQHFMGNISYLLLLGPMLEEKYGSSRIGRVILLTAFITGIVHYLLFWNVALCGASGVVFAFILLTSFTGFKRGEIPITFLLVFVIFIGQQFVQGLTLQDNISNMAHIIGGIVGAVVGYRWNKKR